MYSGLHATVTNGYLWMLQLQLLHLLRPVKHVRSTLMTPIACAVQN